METNDHNYGKFQYELHFISGDVEYFYSHLEAHEFIDQFNHGEVVNEMGKKVYLTNPNTLSYMMQV